MRQLARIAVKGNGPAMRMFIHMIQTIEQEQAVAAQTKEPEGAESRTITDEERARALAVFMAKVRIKGLLKD